MKQGMTDSGLTVRHIQQIVRRMTMQRLKPSGKVYSRKKLKPIKD